MANKSVDAYINELLKQRQIKLNKTPSEIRADKSKELYAKLLDARSNYESAPLRLKDAEKQYYSFKDGTASYNSMQKDKFIEEAKTLKETMTEDHEKDINDAFQALSYYESQRTYIKNINSVKLVTLESIMDKLKKIKTANTASTSNNRKTFYVLEEQQYTSIWLKILNFAIIAFGIVFCIYSVLEQNISAYTFISVAGIVGVVFYLEWIIHAIRSIPLSLNVYTSWGEESDQSTYIFWIIVVICSILYGIVYSTNTSINNYFK